MGHERGRGLFDLPLKLIEGVEPGVLSIFYDGEHFVLGHEDERALPFEDEHIAVIAREDDMVTDADLARCQRPSILHDSLGGPVVTIRITR